MDADQKAHWDALYRRIDVFERKVDERRRVIDEARKKLVLRQFSIAIGVAVVHFLTGIDLLFGGGPASLLTTPLAFLANAIDYVLIFGSHAQLIAGMLIVAAIMATVPFMQPAISRWWFMALLAPQQLLLLSHLISIQTALFVGHYADGYAPQGGASFIFADQVWLLMVIFYHTLEYVEIYKIRVVAELIPVSRDG